MSFKKFLRKHSGELANVATVLGAVVKALPIDRQDKDNLGAVIGDLQGAAKRIARATVTMQDTELQVSAEAVKAAVEAMLPDILGAVAERVFELAKERDGAPAPAPAPAPAKAKAASAPAKRSRSRK